MANVVHFFMAPEDERTFFREIADLGLELYPEVVPPDWKAIPVEEAAADSLVEPAYYLAAPELGPVMVDKVKRGPNRGKWMVLEVTSPVIHFQRSVLEDGVLRSGRLWAELQVSGDVQKRVQKAPRFERVFKRLAEAVARRARKSQPVGYLVLPGAVRLYEAGTELREEGRKGGAIRPYR